MEQIFVVRVNWEKFFAVLVLLEELIHKLGKANFLFNEIGVSETTLANTLRYLTITIYF